MPLQVKLLRVLQERKVRRLGGTTDIPINARIISATNQNLETQIKENRFREDLYYRLNVFNIHLPPLRERPEDIKILAGHFLEKHSGRGQPVLTPEALIRLEHYSFPGNVRELENIIERALIYCENSVIRDIDIDLHETGATPGALSGTLQKGSAGAAKSADSAQDIPAGMKPAAPAVSTMNEIEKQAIIGALSACRGNRTKAAELLGVSRKTILNKIKQFGLE